MKASPSPTPLASAAPAPSPSPAPAAPSGTPPEPPVRFDDKLDAELADIDDDNKPPRPAPPDKPGELAKPASGQDGQTTTTPAAPPKPPKAAELRTAYESVKKERDELKPKVQTLEARIKELEGAQPADLKPLSEKITRLEARNTELESEIRFVNFTKSKEYVDNFQKPYEEAWGRALEDLGEMTVDLGDGQTRKAEPNDLVTLSNMPLNEALKFAKEMFGDAAEYAMGHRRTIRELYAKMSAAVENAKKSAGEREKVTAAEHAASMAKRREAWQKSNDDLVKKYPNVFGPIEGDSEGNALLERGLVEADSLFSPGSVPQEVLPKTPEEAARRHARMRFKIANHDRLLHRLKAVRAELKEAQAKLKEFEDSAPPAGAGTAAPSGSREGNGLGENAWAAELDTLDKR